MQTIPKIIRIPICELKSRQVMDDYIIMDEIGSGTYGKVFKSKKKEDQSQKLYALKMMASDSYIQDGFPVTSLRQIKLLRNLEHKNIVNLIDVEIIDDDQKQPKVITCMIFDYMQYDFYGISRKQGFQFTDTQIKCIMKQLLEGLSHMHQNNVIHRDIKSANILMDENGIIKIADFGLARQIRLKEQLTSTVVTLWYRSPEILLGDNLYEFKADVWSVGCFFAEILLQTPLFPGAVEKEQIGLIIQLCGKPTDEIWPGVESLKHYHALIGDEPQRQPSFSIMFREKIPDIQEEVLDLLFKMLSLNPKQRISAEQALMHPYFKVNPPPCSPDELVKNLPQDMHYLSKRNKSEWNSANPNALIKAIPQIAQPINRNNFSNNHFNNQPYQNKLPNNNFHPNQNRNQGSSQSNNNYHNNNFKPQSNFNPNYHNNNNNNNNHYIGNNNFNHNNNNNNFNQQNSNNSSYYNNNRTNYNNNNNNNFNRQHDQSNNSNNNYSNSNNFKRKGNYSDEPSHDLEKFQKPKSDN